MIRSSREVLEPEIPRIPFGLSVLWAIALFGWALAASRFDVSATHLLAAEQIPGDLARALKLLEIFGHGIGFAIVCSLIWQLTPNLRRHLLRLCTAYLLAGVVVNLLKLIVPRVRPLVGAETVTGQGFFNWDYFAQSFPSGHSASAVVLAIGLSQLFPKGRYLFFVLAGGACLQRISFEAHWLSDVLFGVGIGILVSGLFYFTKWSDRMFFSMENRRRLGRETAEIAD